MRCVCCWEETELALACHPTHLLCDACVQTWNRSRGTCPVCKAPLLVPRERADALASTSNVSVKHLETVVLDFENALVRMHAGVTLRNGALGGVVVIGLHVHDVASVAGLYKGDVLWSLNGLGCHDHAMVNGALDEASSHGRAVECTVQRSRRFRLRRAAQCVASNVLKELRRVPVLPSFF